MAMENTNYFNAPQLLTPPTRRAAFSDRMAYVCAELARLAYFPFEGGSSKEALNIQFNKAMTKAGVDEETRVEALKRLDNQLSQSNLDQSVSKDLFKEALALGGFELVDVFVGGDTQGFLCSKGENAFLVYRGTESLEDALDDLNAKLTTAPFDEDDPSQIHTGFWIQFSDVDQKVKNLLESVKDRQLYIAGHSLGGALAVLATRFYALNGCGACYTFGAPAVSNPEFQKNIKTPIYRIVNEIDPVPRVPSIYVGFFAQFVLHWLYKLLALFGVERSKAADQLIRDLKLYRQNGYALFLVRKENEINLRSISSLTIIDRLKLWWRGTNSKKKLLKFGDFHKMDNYVERLKAWANIRNLKDG